ncbi:hypothetical protein [Sphingopyxis sp. GC21]|uniref:hypothetical protein n=1 Tax=Sphingopyxis sp. GC21 TaxID=2933562 RepID=UPI0021E41C28|nr:hypothetical protein [Sphingopyxis sp. GC21]
MSNAFTADLPHPFYGDHVLYHANTKGLAITPVRAWAFDGWRAEALSWRKGCYIHAGLSGIGPVSIKGSQALEYLQGLCINSFAKFPVGSMKHAVMCNEDGLITAHGVVERLAEDHFLSFAGGPPGPTARSVEGLDVEIEIRNWYLFQIAGPTSLDVLEKVTGEDLRDLKFLRFRQTRINGIECEIARLGMTGSLAYELHGPMSDAPAIYDAVYKAGQEFGIERLGWGSYLVNHIEGGFPQHTWTFVSAPPPEKWPRAMKRWEVGGSVDPMDIRARCRTPAEVRWDNMAKFDHDFIGRDAVEAEIANPRRTTTTLRWNKDDVLDVFASLLREGEPYKPFDFPYSPQRWPMAYADHVEKGGRPVGWSSGTIYSPHYREFLSHGCIDISEAEIGNEVTVKWGDHGGPIKEIRATVERFPYLAQGRNNEIDVAKL